MATTIIRTGIRRAAATAAARSSIPFTSSFRIQEPSSSCSSSVPLQSKNGNFVIVRRIHQNWKRKHAPNPKAEESLLTAKQLLFDWPAALGVLIIAYGIFGSFDFIKKKGGSSKDLTPSKLPPMVANRKRRPSE